MFSGICNGGPKDGGTLKCPVRRFTFEIDEPGIVGEYPPRIGQYTWNGKEWKFDGRFYSVEEAGHE